MYNTLYTLELERAHPCVYPICSMYGIFTNICPKNHPNVGKYTSTMEHMGINIHKIRVGQFSYQTAILIPFGGARAERCRELGLDLGPPCVRGKRLELLCGSFKMYIYVIINYEDVWLYDNLTKKESDDHFSNNLRPTHGWLALFLFVFWMVSDKVTNYNQITGLIVTVIDWFLNYYLTIVVQS